MKAKHYARIALGLLFGIPAVIGMFIEGDTKINGTTMPVTVEFLGLMGMVFGLLALIIGFVLLISTAIGDEDD